MQYPVPQFIDRETKLVGPLTGRQLVVFGAVALVLFILYFLLPTFVVILIGVVLVSIAMALAFVRVNNRPLADVLFSFMSYFFQPRVYLWQKKELSKKDTQKRSQEVLENAYNTSAPETEEQSAAQATPEEIDEAEKIKQLADILNR